MNSDTTLLTLVQTDNGKNEGNFKYREHIFTDKNLDFYESSLLQGIKLVRNTLTTAAKPFSGVLPQELATEIDAIDINRPHDEVSDALAELKAIYLDHAVYFHHPRYVAHLNCPVMVPALLAEILSSSINSSVDTWDQSAGATLIEQKLIDWTAEKIGLGAYADGIFTSGGTQSNLMAILLARDNFCSGKWPECNNRTQGLPDQFRKLRIFSSEASHFSVQKAAAILGLGYESVITVPCDRYFRMDIQALKRSIGSCLADGLIPMAIVATAGTTDFGSIDPLPEIAEVSRTHGLWLHVDSAYGCGLLVSRKFRHLLAGIESADSVTVDYHKSFLQPVSCSAFLVKDKRHFAAIRHHADYLNPESEAEDAVPNLVEKSIQTTRRFDALKLWLTLRTLGADQIGAAFDHTVHLAKQTYLLLLSDPGIVTLHQPQLGTVVFRYRPSRRHSDQELDDANAYIRKALLRSGEALIAGTKVRDRRYLKFTLLNPCTTIHDMQAVLKLIKHHGQIYFKKQGQKPKHAAVGLVAQTFMGDVCDA